MSSICKIPTKNTNLIITGLDNEHLNHHNISFNDTEYSHNERDVLSYLKAIGSPSYKVSELFNLNRQDPNEPNFHSNTLTDPKQIRNKMRDIPTLPTQKFTDITNSNNLFKVFDERKKLVGFLFQDETIKKLWDNYPGIISIDSTHKVIDNCSWTFFVLVCVTGDGETDIIAAFLVKDGCITTLSHIFNFFKDIGNNFTKTSFFISDKDSGERTTMAKFFEASHSLLCIHHVYEAIKFAFKKEHVLSSSDILNILKNYPTCGPLKK